MRDLASFQTSIGGLYNAVRWMMDGHHLGYGTLGAPTGHKLSVMGVTHFHVRDGKIIDERGCTMNCRCWCS